MSTSKSGTAAARTGLFAAAAALPDLEDQSDHVLLRLHDAGLMLVLEDVHDRLEALLEPGPRELVVDMSEVAHLSSTTIAALLWIRRRCSARGVDVVLRAVARRDMGTLQRIGLLGSGRGRASPSRAAPRLGGRA